jgi:hypothetical protein
MGAVLRKHSALDVRRGSLTLLGVRGNRGLPTDGPIEKPRRGAEHELTRGATNEEQHDHDNEGGNDQPQPDARLKDAANGSASGVSADDKDQDSEGSESGENGRARLTK